MGHALSHGNMRLIRVWCCLPLAPIQMWAFGFPIAALAWAAILYDATINTALRWAAGALPIHYLGRLGCGLGCAKL